MDQQTVSPTPDWRDHVYLADSRSMIEVPDQSVALIVTSPPYFSTKDYSKDGHQLKRHSGKVRGQIGDIPVFSEFLQELLSVWRECERVLRPNGKLVINSPLVPMLKREMSTHENRHIFDLNAEIQHSILHGLSQLFLLDTYIWNRTNPSKKLMFGSYPFPANFYAQNTIEFVTVYVKGGKAAPRPPQTREASRLSQQEWVNFTKQVWDIPVPNQSDIAFGSHTALMPDEIARRCIRLFSFVDDVVLDPFAGSGTTLKAARDLQRRFVGYEIMKSYGELINLKLGDGVCRSRTKNATSSTDANLPTVAEIAQTAWGKVHLDSVVVSDCVEFLSSVPRMCVDLACVDPPYNMGKAEWDTWPSRESFMEFSETWLSSLLQTLKPGGGLFVFNTPQNAARLLVFLESKGCQFQNWITWDKRDGFASTRRRFVPGQETILYLTMPGGAHKFHADAVRVPYESSTRIDAARNTGILKAGKRWYPNPGGKLCTDVWHVTSDRHKRKEKGRVQASEHPTPKPLDLIERIILAASDPGDLVLDCFAGTGTVPLAAVRTGRHFLACDRESAFVNLAQLRVEKELSTRDPAPSAAGPRRKRKVTS